MRSIKVEMPCQSRVLRGCDWKPNEIEFLREHYPLMSHMEIGKHLGRSRNAVRGKAWELKLRKKPLVFSESEKQVIRELYKMNIPLMQIASHLKRPKSSVCYIAGKMGLTDISRNKQLSDEQRQALSNRTREWIKRSGHPRGSREWRICPICGRAFEVKCSARKECCGASCATRKRMQGLNNFSRSKSGKREDLGGQFFRSNYEANYARYLNFIIKQGSDILRWEFEPDTFEFKSIRRGTRFYTPDFKIFLSDGHIEYHEVKGWDYPKGKTARKRFHKYFPHLKLVLIDGEFFKAIKRQGIDSLVENWE